MTTDNATSRVVTFIALCAIVAVLAVVLLGCGEDETSNDSAKLANDISGAVVLAFPDGFSNVAAKCFGSTMVFSTYHEADGRAVAAAPNHEWCEDGVLTVEETLK